MTEAEWLACGEVHPVLEVVSAAASERKLRLFAVACTRRVQHLFVHDVCQRAVEMAERFADGLVAESECRAAFVAVDAFFGRIIALASAAHDEPDNEEVKASLTRLTAAGFSPDVAIDVTEAAVEAVRLGGPRIGVEKYHPGTYYSAALAMAGSTAQPGGFEHARNAEAEMQCRVLRDVFGNPFRPATFSPSWRTDTAVSLARQMYESRDFGAMPILADALQDAECDSDDVLSHCRGEGPHVRGCWVVDSVLGKE